MPKAVASLKVTTLNGATANAWPEDPRRGRYSPLAWALLISVALHVGGIVGWEGARIIARAFPGLFPKSVQDALLPKTETVKRDELRPTPAVRPPSEEDVEIPLTFIEVDPSLAAKETPKSAKFYSTDNTLAANPNPPKITAPVPRIDGQRPDIARTFDVVKPAPPTPAPAPSPPVPEPATAAVKPSTEATPQPSRVPQEKAEKLDPGGLKAGETQLAKANPEAVVERPQPRRESREAQAAQQEQAPPELQPVRRPIKRLADARQQKGIIVGEKMKQEGGVERLSIDASFDVRKSPYGDYDRAFIAAVQQRWYSLLQEHHFAFERGGKVTLKFKLRSDGSIADMEQIESEVGDVWGFLCESAVLTQAPFARWPADMRRLVGADAREITFTFHYYY